MDDLPSMEPFNDCTLIVDATVQEIPRPSGTFDEVKQWYSGKHGMYCLKSQIVINRMGLAVHIVTSVPGSTHDLSILRDSLGAIDEYLSRFKEDVDGKILADKGYICNDLSDRLVTPIKERL